MSNEWQTDPMACEFTRRLGELSRETGICVFGHGDWPALEHLRPSERNTDFGYVVKSWGQIEWERLDSKG